MTILSFFKKHKKLNIFAVFIWCALIFMGSSFEGNSLPPQISTASIILHTLEYMILSILLYPLFGFYPALFLSTFYGVTDEIHQLFVVGRFFSFSDIGADFFGSFLGVMLFRRICDEA